MATAGKRVSPPGVGALAVGAVVLGAAAMLIVPLPKLLIDLLITINLAVSMTLLLAAGYARSPLSVATFPTLLVLTTLFRLALNVSTVRLILLQADAGEVVRAFGSVVVRGDYVVGGAVFLILTIVQYVVIARGAERVAEVAARFTLDAMPGRQLAIDADLRARSIEPAEARRRRAALQREAQLYGALDGAMRFVKGDAVAALAILAISLVGGLGIGMLRHNMPLGEAAQLYTLLTVGDGLASQIPALLIASAAGLLVTRVSSDEEGASLGSEMLAQFLGRPLLLFAVAGVLALLALLPGLPIVPFALVGMAFAAGAVVLLRRNNAAPPDAAPLLPVPPAPLELVLPAALAALPGLGAALDGELRALVDDLGVAVPPLTLRPVGSAADSRADAVPASRAVLVRLHGTTIAELPASQTTGPEAVAAGVALALRRAAPSLVGLDETERMVEALSGRCPALCREVVPRRLDLPALAEVLRRLLAEGVPIGDLREILEALAAGPAPDAASAPSERDPAVLVERVRRRMAPRISARLAPAGRLSALLLDPLVEEAVRDAVRPGQSQLALEPAIADDILASLGTALGSSLTAAALSDTSSLSTLDASWSRGARRAGPGGGPSIAPPPVLLVPGDLRPQLAQLVAATQPGIFVVAYEELGPEVEVIEAGRITPSGPEAQPPSA